MKNLEFSNGSFVVVTNRNSKYFDRKGRVLGSRTGNCYAVDITDGPTIVLAGSSLDFAKKTKPVDMEKTALPYVITTDKIGVGIISADDKLFILAYSVEHALEVLKKDPDGIDFEGCYVYCPDGDIFQIQVNTIYLTKVTE